MFNINSFNEVKPVIEEASISLFPTFKINTERYDVLKACCSIIDLLAREFEGKSIEAVVSDADFSVLITLECVDLSLASPIHIFYTLANPVQLIKFSVSDNGNLNVTFVFPSVWELNDEGDTIE